nr:EAL domain-containing protein [uncultured Ruminococcus sp.]
MDTEKQIMFRPSAEQRRILIVEDETVNLRLLTRYLEDSYLLVTAKTGAEALEIIHEQFETISLILLDLNLPDIQGIEILRQLKADPGYAHLPIIVMTADNKAEVDCLTLGAIDFIPKPYPQREIVLARIRRIVELSEDRDTLRWTERDHLTNLYNRDFFYHYAVLLDDHHKDVQTDALVVDINHFHTINERYGKGFGDRVLRRMADRALELVKDSGGIVCRSGADTFFIYCPHLSDYSGFPEKLEICIKDDDGCEHRIRVRVGIYSCVDKSLDIERRFDRAKIVADSVKGSITKAICFYDNNMYEEELLAEQLIEDFPTALKEKQFKVYYQPKFNISSDVPVLCSAEALVRWIHPKMGMVSPGVFIPLFENNGMIEALDYYVWNEAAKQICSMKDTLGVHLPVSVNVSRIDMEDPALIDKLLGIVEKNGLDCGDLILEITESAYTDDAELIVETAKKLREHGFCIEMDDFGTGYSSLNMLASLPIDVLKLDMLFIRSAFQGQRSTRLLEAIISLAKALEVPCIAEGVETAEQVDALKKMGCNIIQGYFFSRPLPELEFEHFVMEHKTLPEAAEQ